MWRQKSLREKEIQELERVWGLAPYESEDQPGSRAILDRRCPCRRLGYHGRAPCRNSAIAPGGSRIDGKLGLEPLSRFPNTAPACGATANTAPGANEFARLPKLRIPSRHTLQCQNRRDCSESGAYQEGITAMLCDCQLPCKSMFVKMNLGANLGRYILPQASLGR